VTVLRVVDFETNGVEPPAEVIEMGWCDLSRADGEGPWIVGEPVGFLYGAEALKPEVRAIHHISPAEIAGAPPFDPGPVVEQAVVDNVSAFVAHNWSFEGQWLTAKAIGQMRTLCTYKAALRVWPDAPSHSNGALRYWLEDQGLIALDHAKTQPAHRAGPDAYVTAHVLKALLAKTTGREMIAWTAEPALLPRCPIGKFRGKPWADVEAGFLTWMLNQASMEEDLKWNARRELDRRKVPA
jgi:exodeoxyribonuclease X